MAATQISRSLRFNSADSAYLDRTFASAGNRKTWTYSVWLKRSGTAESGRLLSDTANSAFIRWGTDNAGANNAIYWRFSSGPTYVESSASFRDLSAWYHFIFVADTTQATASDRLKIYVNGTQIAIAFSSYPTLNADGPINNNTEHQIGLLLNGSFPSGVDKFDGYLTEINFIDGQALTPNSFGFFDNDGVWAPKQYTGPYGTNGFYLPMNVPYETFTADFLVVAGGAGGGGGGTTTSFDAGGGGGAGGYREFTGQSLAIGPTYTVTVGAGGAAVQSAQGNDGNTSTFATIDASGGGGGGWNSALSGKNGGSGGGAVYAGSGGSRGTPGSGNSGSYSPVEGFDGGTTGATADSAGSGGGGASAIGGASSGSPTASTGGNGGAGTASSITGSSVTRAGGGGGGVRYSGETAGTGGAGGGGAGGVQSAAGTNGTANTGGGGGGGGSGAFGGAGGSGVVIIKIPDTRTATFSGGVTSSLSTAVSGYKIYTVTATSTTSETVTFS
jgi:hypothetical protein